MFSWPYHVHPQVDVPVSLAVLLHSHKDPCNVEAPSHDSLARSEFHCMFHASGPTPPTINTKMRKEYYFDNNKYKKLG